MEKILHLYKKGVRVEKVTLQAYYNLDGEYLWFQHNPLDAATFENVVVKIGKGRRTIGEVTFVFDVIQIEGQNSIECELVDCTTQPDGTLLIKICQDWG